MNDDDDDDDDDDADADDVEMHRQCFLIISEFQLRHHKKIRLLLHSSVLFNQSRWISLFIMSRVMR